MSGSRDDDNGESMLVVQRLARVGEKIIHEGDIITLNGGTGEVYLGAIPTIPAHFSNELAELLAWADETADLAVMSVDGGRWFGSDWYVASPGEGLMVKRNFDG